MKTLYLIRHAKSSWSFKQLDDFSRPLGIRGRKDVIKVGKHLAKNVSKPDGMITSPASRAFYTTLFLADSWGFPEDSIQLEPELYHADEEEIIETIHEYGSNHSILAIAGHNPGFTDLANSLQTSYIDNLPTCCVMGITFNTENWEDVGRIQGKKQFIIYPKSL